MDYYVGIETSPLVSTSSTTRVLLCTRRKSRQNRKRCSSRSPFRQTVMVYGPRASYDACLAALQGLWERVTQ